MPKLPSHISPKVQCSDGPRIRYAREIRRSWAKASNKRYHRVTLSSSLKSDSSPLKIFTMPPNNSWKIIDTKEGWASLQKDITHKLDTYHRRVIRRSNIKGLYQLLPTKRKTISLWNLLRSLRIYHCPPKACWTKAALRTKTSYTIWLIWASTSCQWQQSTIEWITWI